MALTGSTVRAVSGASLSAAGDVVLRSAQESASETTQSRSSGFSLGANVGVGPGGMTAGVSLSAKATAFLAGVKAANDVMTNGVTMADGTKRPIRGMDGDGGVTDYWYLDKVYLPRLADELSKTTDAAEAARKAGELYRLSEQLRRGDEKADNATWGFELALQAIMLIPTEGESAVLTGSVSLAKSVSVPVEAAIAKALATTATATAKISGATTAKVALEATLPKGVASTTEIVLEKTPAVTTVDDVLAKGAGTEANVVTANGTANAATGAALKAELAAQQAAGTAMLQQEIIAIRSILPGDAAVSGNVAAASVDIPGIQPSLVASSRINRVESPALIDKGLIGETLPVLPATELPLASGRLVLRDADSEYKILNYIANRLGDNTGATGSITLMSELKPCASCLNAIKSFKVKYPNITINVVAYPNK